MSYHAGDRVIARVICAALLLLLVSTSPVQALTTGHPTRPQAVHNIIPEILGLNPREAQQVTCDAFAVYLEMRGKEQRAQFAVAFVVYTRAADPRFPNTPCAVLWQQSGDPKLGRWMSKREYKRTLAKMNHNPREVEAWQTAQRIAYLAHVDREIQDPTNGATHFHEKSVNPRWASDGYDKVTVERHVFMKLPDTK